MITPLLISGENSAKSGENPGEKPTRKKENIKFGRVSNL
jgi:hypothetical protein